MKPSATVPCPACVPCPQHAASIRYPQGPPPPPPPLPRTCAQVLEPNDLHHTHSLQDLLAEQGGDT